MSARADRTLACVRCGGTVDASTPWTGCPTCATGGVNVNILPTYAPATADSVAARPSEPGLFQHRARLPIDDDWVPVSLDEGRTPAIASERLASDVGVAGLWLKDESRNPTWSYKDRLAAVAVTEARARGADTIAVSTTGNHGAAAAAYAARAGLRCIALTMESVPATMKTLMQSYGASVVALRTGPERWQLLRAGVEERGWVPLSGMVDPPVGSNPFGIDAYKTIAFELVEQLGEAPDAVVVPAAYADGLTGIQRGFADLLEAGTIPRQPRMVAVDPFGAYAAAMAHGDDRMPRVEAGATVSFSIGTPIATYQGVDALRRSDGFAMDAPDDERVMSAQRRIGATCGLFLEASSATTLVAVADAVRAGLLDHESRVVCLATSTGLKDVDAAADRLPPVPVIGASLPQLDAALEAQEAA